MKYWRSNSILLLTLLLFVLKQQRVFAQIFGTELLEQRATALYYQGAYPNVSQAIATYDDFNTTGADWERIDYFNLVTSLRLNSPGAVKAISSFTLEYPNTHESRWKLGTSLTCCYGHHALHLRLHV